MDVRDVHADGLEGRMISTAPRLADIDAAHLKHLHQGIMVLAVTPANALAELIRTERNCPARPG